MEATINSRRDDSVKNVRVKARKLKKNAKSKVEFHNQNHRIVTHQSINFDVYDSQIGSNHGSIKGKHKQPELNNDKLH